MFEGLGLVERDEAMKRSRLLVWWIDDAAYAGFDSWLERVTWWMRHPWHWVTRKRYAKGYDLGFRMGRSMGFEMGKQSIFDSLSDELDARAKARKEQA
jgi:hypothetical protein